MPASRYAETTSVPSEKSRMDIERVLTQHGADTVAAITGRGAARIMFEMGGRQIRFDVPLPDRRADDFQLTATGKTRTANAAEAVYEQAVRQRWRALYLVIRARLEAIEAGIETFEEAFLAHIQLPDGSTVGELSRPAIAAAYSDPDHPMPALLPGGSNA